MASQPRGDVEQPGGARAAEVRPEPADPTLRTALPNAVELGTSSLTDRELTVLQLVASGYTSKQIAQLLASTAKAVDLTISRASRRLGASHRAEAIAIALRRGLIL